MLVPEFWAEAKEVVVHNGRKATIKRFGWSDISQDEALTHANTRVAEAIDLLKADKKLKRLERKISYNGADGLPIREEIIKRIDDFVITRNSYGALCLNTPDVLFGDIDFPEISNSKSGIIFLTLLVISCILVFVLGLSKLAFLSLLLTPVFSYIYTQFIFKKPDYETEHLESIKSIVAQNPDWRIRVYKTPNGYRILALHQLFDPQSDETIKFNDRFKTDPLYRTMCINQNCFRARVSPKPWRIGISDHLRPRPGVWPIAAENMPQRLEWVNHYESKAKDFASCKFLMELGAGKANEKALSVQKVHDEYCRSTSDLPIA
jgi:hypothetical protein